MPKIANVVQFEHGNVIFYDKFNSGKIALYVLPPYHEQPSPCDIARNTPFEFEHRRAKDRADRRS